MLSMGNESLFASNDMDKVDSPNENHSIPEVTSTCHPRAYNTAAQMTEMNISNVDTTGESHMKRFGMRRHSKHDSAGIAVASNTNVTVDVSLISFTFFPSDR